MNNFEAISIIFFVKNTLSLYTVDEMNIVKFDSKNNNSDNKSDNNDKNRVHDKKNVYFIYILLFHIFSKHANLSFFLSSKKFFSWRSAFIIFDFVIEDAL